MGVLSALLGQFAAVDALASYVLQEWGDLIAGCRKFLPQKKKGKKKSNSYLLAAAVDMWTSCFGANSSFDLLLILSVQRIEVNRLPPSFYSLNMSLFVALGIFSGQSIPRRRFRFSINKSECKEEDYCPFLASLFLKDQKFELNFA